MRIAAVVIAHNVAEWVGRALVSVFEQVRRPEHVVVVENGSSDGTRRVIEQTLSALAPDDGRVTTLWREQLGPGGARNLGAEAAIEAGAEELAFLDGDDWWSPAFVGVTERALAARADRVAAFGWTVVRDAGGRLRSVRVRARRDFDYRDLCVFKSPMVTASSLLVRAENFQAVGGFRSDLLSGEDWELLLRLVERGGVVACAREFIVNYRKRPGSLTTDALRSFEGLEKIEQAHPRARRAKHWWWPLNQAVRSGRWDLVDRILDRRPAVRPADLLSLQFVKYLANRLRFGRARG